MQRKGFAVMKANPENIEEALIGITIILLYRMNILSLKFILVIRIFCLDSIKLLTMVEFLFVPFQRTILKVYLISLD